MTCIQRLSILFSVWFGVIIVIVSTQASAMTDSATGIAFEPKNNGLEIFGVGVRKKGPIKVYSVAMYGSPELKESLSTISSTSSKHTALETISKGVKEPEPSATFLLQMSFKVGAEKMASAISDSVKPRHTGNAADIEQLRTSVVNGLVNGATKGTKIQFDCTKDGIQVVIDGKSQGTVPSESLAKAFCDVYLDDNCVSPALRDSCVKNCCST
jgi:Chalcone isomerase-like